MKVERAKNAIRNTKWGFAQKLVNILFPFLVRSVLLYTLSAEYAGLSSLFTSILQILSLAELGFSNAIVYSMYKPIAEDDGEKVCALLNVYRKAYFIIGSVILGFGLLLIPLLPHLINGEVPSNTNLYVLYLIYLFNSVVSYFLFGYKTSLLSAHQREDVVSKNTLLYNIVLYGIQCIVLLCFRNYYIYAIVIPFSTVLLNVLNNLSVKRMFPNYVPFGNINEKEKTELKKNLIGLTIWKIGGATRNTLDSVVISMYLGLVSVAMYNNYYYIVFGLNTFLGVFSSSITAGVGNKIVTDTTETNYEDFKKFHFYYMWISGWCAVCLMCLFQPFMKLWVGKELMFSNSIMFLFCYYFMMTKQSAINNVYYQVIGLWWEGKFRSVIEALLNLVLNFTLGYYLGVVGIILATIISYTCMYFYGSTFIFTKYFKNGKLNKYFVDNILYMMVTGVIGFVTFKLLEVLLSSQNNDWIELGIRALVCIILPNVFFALIYRINKDNRKYMNQAIVQIKERFRKI